MASGIHTVSPQNSINLVSDTLPYDSLSKSEYNLHNFVSFEESQEYPLYNQNPDVYNYVDDSSGVDTNISLNLPPFTPQTVITCSNNNKSTITNCEQTTACVRIYHQGYDSDESSISYSSRETPENKETKFQCSRIEKKTGKDQNESYARSCVLQPNLYQPNNNYQKNSKYYFRGGQRSKFLKSSEETERKIHGLMRRFKSRAHKMKINPNPQILFIGGPWDPLNQAIWDMFVSKIQKEETYINKLNLWREIFLFFKVCLSNCGLYLVGSTMSGFALEGSDIDICLLTKPVNHEPRVDSLQHLSFLQHGLLKSGLASEAELVMAKVPILKFKSKDTGFKIDLNCNNIVGIQNTRLLYTYAQLDWRVRPLVAIVKIWAQTNNINDAKNMTISSYSWTLMVIHYLQCGVFPPVLPCLHSLYPEEFNSHEKRTMDVQGEVEGLKENKSENKRCLVRTGSRLPIEMCKQVKSPKNDPHQWKFLCIEEPFDLSNTARSVFDVEIFKHIKQVIVASYKQLACNKVLSEILPIIRLNDQR